MNDASTPSVSPKRAWTILGRLTRAVREQNWFAVTLEVCIVVLGVVIGFQVTGWGQARSDLAKERAYLLQLAEDLHATEQQTLWADSTSRPFDAASSQLVRAFFAPEPPPADSILAWRLGAIQYRPLLPVTGTAEALIASGDLSLIQSDSLRSEITAYVPFVAERQVNYAKIIDKWWGYSVEIANRYDLGDMVMSTMDAEAVDSMAVADLHTFLPAGERRRPFPVDVDAMLADREVYNAFRGMLEEKRGMNADRRFVRNATRRLRSQVERELNRRWQISPTSRTDSTGSRWSDGIFEGL